MAQKVNIFSNDIVRDFVVAVESGNNRKISELFFVNCFKSFYKDMENSYNYLQKGSRKKIHWAYMAGFVRALMAVLKSATHHKIRLETHDGYKHFLSFETCLTYIRFVQENLQNEKRITLRENIGVYANKSEIEATFKAYFDMLNEMDKEKICSKRKEIKALERSILDREKFLVNL